ncbi:hypothetical protein BC936DRAFT_150085 [Jimgerdemannia flammicorona]|uniref:Uncharacterized protein n=1 Tax=Jimgerdemannia flammicorona TaxID=994334 RepID=A0A433CZJ2_9FUNG|nr:hypothetical protein BC936DRAFT_150085 [Jimgerdemannia flammicorona]
MAVAKRQGPTTEAHLLVFCPWTRPNCREIHYFSEKALFQFSEGLVPVLRRPCSSSPKALFQFSEGLVPVLRRPCSSSPKALFRSQEALFQFSEGLDLILRRETKHPLSDTKGIYYLIDGFGALNTTLLNDFLASLKSCIGKQRAHCRKMLPAALIFQRISQVNEQLLASMGSAVKIYVLHCVYPGCTSPEKSATNFCNIQQLCNGYRFSYSCLQYLQVSDHGYKTVS